LTRHSPYIERQPGIVVQKHKIKKQGEYEMLVHVTLYGALRVITAQQMLDMSFDEQHITMMQLLEALTALYPRIGPYLIDDSSQTLHTEMRILLNGTRPKPDLTLSTPLYDNDRLTFLVATH
jgi:hypothetical protein